MTKRIRLVSAKNYIIGNVIIDEMIDVIMIAGKISLVAIVVVKEVENDIVAVEIEARSLVAFLIDPINIQLII